MSEDTTRRFDGRSFEQQVLEELRAINTRLTALEEIRGTRKLWDNLMLRITAIEKLMQSINAQLGEVVRDLFVQRGRIATLEEREHQRPPAA